MIHGRWTATVGGGGGEHPQLVEYVPPVLLFDILGCWELLERVRRFGVSHGREH